ncbi:ABC transporter ATP-binding protein [Natrialba swarupiae]|nr:ABC transporter ATP-binding protein [Natrialba swarupiae]
MIQRVLRRSSARDSQTGGDSDANTAVRLDGVTHSYGSAGGRLDADRDPTVIALRTWRLRVTRVRPSVSRPSGSGKSTILHAIAGLLVPTAGSVEILGTDITRLSDHERTRLRRRHVGIVFQRFHLLPSLSARANVALPLVQAGVPRSTRRERATTLLSDVGLSGRATHLPSELSGGECQRVAIARALATDPDVIVADEPTGELDTETGSTVLELLTDVGSDRAVVVASHDDDTLAITDRVVTLRDGSVMSDGG